jgi:nitrite reductase/ring-hydroxylating ferredoxin subunit
VIRTRDNGIKAFFNVCQHRGRQLIDNSFGHAKLFHCRFHGWQFNIDGSLARVLDREDWKGCPDFGDSELRLKEARVDTWGGFVFVNPDQNAEALSEFLGPIPGLMAPFELEKLRYRWYKSIKLPCNWKVALEAFSEGYHAFATHPQMMHCYGDDWTRSASVGKHGMFGFPGERRPIGAPSVRLGKPVPSDLRRGVVEWHTVMEKQLAAMTSERDWQASFRILEEVPEGASFPEIFAKLMQFYQDAAVASGAGWPEATPEDLTRAGSDWHVFPNFIFLPFFDGTLAYRARPAGDDPDWCIFDIYSLVRYAPGAEPVLQREFYLSDTDWKENIVEKVGLIPSQDISNMQAVQKGMKSAGFRGARTNPLQESAISNFHRVLYEHMLSDV